MALPTYTSKDELDASGAPVVPNAPVIAAEPNRGNENLSDSVDHLAFLQRVHQSLSFDTAPRMLWDAGSATLTLSAALVISYVVDDPSAAVATRYKVTLGAGTWQFSAGAKILYVPLGFNTDVSITAGGATSPGSAGSPRFFVNDGEAQQFFRTETNTNGRESALRYIQLARVAGTTLQLLGLPLRSGAAVEDFRDAEYSGDETTAATRRMINQDRGLMLHGGGTPLFSAPTAATRVMTVTSAVFITAPDNTTTKIGFPAGGVKLSAATPVMIATIGRTTGAAVGATAAAASWSSISASNDNMIVLGLWGGASDDVFRWRWSGSGYRPGDSFPIGVNFDLTPTYLIESFLVEFVYPTDLAAHTGLTAMGATDRLAFVVDGTNDEVVRPVTQKSIALSGPAGDPTEVIRVLGMQGSRVFASGTHLGVPVVVVRNTADSADAGVSAAFLLTDTIRTLTGASVSVRDTNGVDLRDFQARVIATGGAGSYFLGDELRSSFFSVLNAAGLNTAELGVNQLKTEVIRATGAELRIEPSGAPLGTSLHPVRAKSAHHDQFVRVDGTGGLTEPQVRTAGSEVAFRDAAGINMVSTRSLHHRVQRLYLHDTSAVTGLGIARIATSAGPPPTIHFGDDAGAPSVNLQAMSTEVASIRTLVDAASYVTVTDRAGANRRDMWARAAYVDERVHFGDPAFPGYKLERVGSILEYRDATSLVAAPIQVSSVNLEDSAGFVTVAAYDAGAGDIRVRVVDGASKGRIEASRVYLADDAAPANLAAFLEGGTGGSAGKSFAELRKEDDLELAYLVAEGVWSRNTNVGGGSFSYNGATWVIDGGALPLAAMRATAVAENVNVMDVTLPFNVNGLDEITWTYSAQDEGGSSYPVLMVLESETGNPSVLSFSFWAGTSLIAGYTVGDQILGTDLRNIRFSLNIQSNQALP